MAKPKIQKIIFIQALLPVAFLFALILYGLLIHPEFLHQQPLPLKIVFLAASIFSITQLRLLGFQWEEIQKGIIKKLSKALPALFILFSIGLIIGSWIVWGTIPMLVYYGIKTINTDYIYILAFLVPVVFSTFTGTSWGSVKKKVTIPILLTSTVIAVVLAFIFQRFTFFDVIQTIYNGFDTKMAFWINSTPENIDNLFNSGGLYELSEPIIISIMVFVYIGSIDKIDAMTIIVTRLFRFAKKRSTVIISSLFSTAITNAMTSNQFATSFVVGDAFITKYDKLKIPRKVLSQSLEDYGTMIESLVPWTTISIFIVATLGVPYADYWHWQL